MSISERGGSGAMLTGDGALAQRNTVGKTTGRAGLLGTSALSGGTMRGLVLATGVAAAASLLAPSQAAAQFVCVGNSNGAVVGEGFFGTSASGAGAAATPGGMACGPGSAAVGVNAVAVGDPALAFGANATAVGSFSRAVGTNATAVGENANATGFAATATGAN